jgi:hypothetical protein
MRTATDLPPVRAPEADKSERLSHDRDARAAADEYEVA